MKRSVAFLVGIIAVAALLMVAAAVWWVINTTAGARWLLDAVSRHGVLPISVQKVEGRLIGHLLLSGIQITEPQQKLELDSLDLRWKPLLLFAGTVGIQELTLRGVRIQDTAPSTKKPLQLAWPRVSGIAELFEGKIGLLRVDRLSYSHLNREPTIINSLVCSVTWQANLLFIKDLAADSPSGSVAGNIEAGFQRPSLKTDLVVSPAQPVAEMDLFSLQTRLLPGKSPEHVSGSFTIVGSKKKAAKQRLELSGELGMTMNILNLRRLHLIKTGVRGKITGEGSLNLAKAEPLLTMQLQATDLNLASELNLPTDLSGKLTLSGTMESYRGHFAFANKGKGLQAIRLSSEYQGTGSGLKLSGLSGSVLDGSVQGNLDLDWREGVTVQGALSGRNLNPAKISSDWSGVANFDLKGNMAWSKQGPIRGEVNGKLLESRLHGQALTGEVLASFIDDNLLIDRLALRGKGFDIHAAGKLDTRLAWSAHVSDLSRLIPGTAGGLRAAGWVNRQKERLGGEFTGHGRNLSGRGIRIAGADLSARLKKGADYPLHVKAAFRNVVYDRLQADSVNLVADGTALDHSVDMTLRSTVAEARLTLSGAYSRGDWRGKIVRFSGRDSFGPWSLASPASLAVTDGRIALTPLIINGAGPERIEVAADLNLDPLSGSVRTEWGSLNLARANPWLNKVRVSGSSSGKIRMELPTGKKRLALAGNASAYGTVTSDGRSITVQSSSLSLDGGEHGLNAGIELQVSGAILKGSFTSPLPARPAIPEEGNITLDLKNVDLALLRPWLPPAAKLAGNLNGRATGKLLPGQRFELDGETVLSQGKFAWKRPEGEMDVNLKTASVSWGWRGEKLRGALDLALAEYGQVRGTFQLPVTARFPVVISPTGPIQASLTGQVKEKGILTALFPGVVQESHGELDTDLKFSGTWNEPKIEGKLHLAKAGAYLPTAGIHVSDVQLSAVLEKDLVRINSFRAVSGPGYIAGTALLQLKGRQVTSYNGNITGERFQTVYFPELQMQSTPRLTFEGTPERVAIRGDVHLPVLLIVGKQSRPAVAPSKDVIVEERARPAAKTLPFDMDIQVRLVLGDRVLVKMEGIDAQLGGAVDLKLPNFDRITSKGEIKVIKGRYRTYGVNLEIVRGRLFYAGGSVNQPTLDILALRTIGDVKAGVTAGGTLQAPVIKLYSEPTMPDVDVLAYIVLGHPLGSSGEQAGLLTQAAGVLLSTGQSAVLQDQIKNRLGLSTLEIQTGGQASGRMGYKPTTVAPPGAATKNQSAGMSQTFLTVGKYLTPQLYISYGRSLFSNENRFLLRYDIFKSWQIETQTGSASGADLYYKIEFN